MCLVLYDCFDVILVCCQRRLRSVHAELECIRIHEISRYLLIYLIIQRFVYFHHIYIDFHTNTSVHLLHTLVKSSSYRHAMTDHA